MRFLTFSMKVTIQAGTRKTAINFLKTIRKNIDGSLKSFWVSGISDPDTQKDFFQQGQRNRFAIENEKAAPIKYSSEILRHLDYTSKYILYLIRSEYLSLIKANKI